jgi:hypothetical protein
MLIGAGRFAFAAHSAVRRFRVEGIEVSNPDGSRIDADRAGALCVRRTLRGDATNALVALHHARNPWR